MKIIANSSQTKRKDGKFVKIDKIQKSGRIQKATKSENRQNRQIENYKSRHKKIFRQNHLRKFQFQSSNSTLQKSIFFRLLERNIDSLFIAIQFHKCFVSFAECNKARKAGLSSVFRWYCSSVSQRQDSASVPPTMTPTASRPTWRLKMEEPEDLPTKKIMKVFQAIILQLPLHPMVPDQFVQRLESKSNFAVSERPKLSISVCGQ